MDLTLLTAAPLLLLLAGACVVLWTTRSHRDPTSLLTIFIALLFVLQAKIVVGPMGAIGSPALIFGLGLAVIWAMAKAIPASGIERGFQPVRIGLLVYAGVMLLSYANGQLRPLSELEESGSSRALLYLLCLLGVGLLVADGVQSRERLDTLLRRLVFAGGFLAVIGVVQFLFSYDLAPHFRPPGLSLNSDIVGIGTRSDFNRPWGTSQHAIEFSVVLGALLPLAVHYAMTATTLKQRIVHWALVGLMAAGMAMSVSRSGVVAAGVGLTFLSLGWSWRQRLNAAAYATAFTAFMWAAVPGLVGTIHSLFIGTGNDPSIVARRERVPIVMDLVAEHPWLGHGFGTFNVEEYLLVDNELFVTAIATGWIGLTAFLGVIALAVLLALGVRRYTTDPSTKHLGWAIAASLLGLAVCTYTFDAFFYRQFTGVLFLLIGAAGALWRLQRASSADPVLIGSASGRTALPSGRTAQ